MTENEIKFLKLFPTNKDALTLQELFDKAAESHLPEQETKEMMSHFRKKKMMIGLPNEFSITKYGLDELNKEIELIQKAEKTLVKKEKDEKRMNWPKIYWWALPAILFVVGVIWESMKKHATDEQKDKQDQIQLSPTTPTSVDTSVNHKTLSLPSDTIRALPKSSDSIKK